MLGKSLILYENHSSITYTGANIGMQESLLIYIIFLPQAIKLEQALQQANQEDFSSSIANFYQLKYGTTSPNLKRIDSTLRHATISSSPSTQVRIQKISSSDDGIQSLNFTGSNKIPGIP